MTTNVHVIPHTHWDREWYFDTTRSTVYLIKHIKEVLDTLEKNNDYTYYLLDAQLSLIADYLEHYPEDYNRIKKLVKSKRLLTGPWYAQTDQLVIGQESIVRNLFYGIKEGKDLGHSMEVGYVPDSFGQGGNMPQIYDKFGINTATFWRGIADTTFSDTEFIWEGTDGTQVLAHIMRHGYNYGSKWGLPEEDKLIKDWITEYVDQLEQESNAKNIYLPHGFDQSPIRKNLPELVDKFNKLDSTRNYILSSPELYFKYLAKEADDFDKIQGELIEGKHSRTHKTIFSTRADLKQLNNKAENYLVNSIEPLLFISNKLGFDYPKNEIETIWKLLFENSAHDSIGGCNSDTTNRDVEYRYTQALNFSRNLEEMTMRKISNSIQSDEDISLLLFNTLPYKRDAIMEMDLFLPSLDFTVQDEDEGIYSYQIIESLDMTEYILGSHRRLDTTEDIYMPEKVYKVKLKIFVNDLPALGYKNLVIQDINIEQEEDLEVLESTEDFIENKHFKILVNENNTLEVYDKINEKLYSNQMLFTDSGDGGDSYNFSPPRNDFEITSHDAELVSVNIVKGGIDQSLNIKLTLPVPYDLEDRANKKMNSKLEISATVTLEKDNNIIGFYVDIKNNILSHKVSVVFSTGIASQFSYADHLFGQIKRPVKFESESYVNWREEGWNEKPIAIEPMQNYVALSDETSMFSVMTNGVREYEIIGSNYDKIKLTLYRTFSHMGKKDLLWRPGRASGETTVPTPDAQLKGDLSFEFYVLIESNRTLGDVNLSKISKEIFSPVLYYLNTEYLNGTINFVQNEEEERLPLSFSALDIFNEKNIGISAVKKSEYNDNLILRIFNPYLDRNVDLEKSNKSRFVKLDEIELDTAVSDLKPNKFATLEIPIDNYEE